MKIKGKLTNQSFEEKAIGHYQAEIELSTEELARQLTGEEKRKLWRELISYPMPDYEPKPEQIEELKYNDDLYKDGNIQMCIDKINTLIRAYNGRER
jgi:hypothetical protein